MPSRRQRHEIEKTERTRAAQRQRIIFVIGGIATAIILVAIGMLASNQLAAASSATPVAVGQAQCTSVQTFASQGGTHIDPNAPHPPYNSNPPTSGWHWANPQDWGIYATAQVQEQLVHNLERRYRAA